MGRRCPRRSIRPTRCSSTAGFQGTSNIDAGAHRSLQVQANAAGIGREKDTTGGVVVEIDEVLRAPHLALLAGEERRRDALARELGARRPVREPEHPPPLAEHHHFAALGHGELSNQLAQLDELGARKALKCGIRRPLDP